MELPPRPDNGERVVIAGRTGSGKSTLCCYLLKRSPQTWLILNPKHTAAFKSLPDVVVLTKFDERQVTKEQARHKYVLLNLSGHQATADYMDEIISWAHGSFRNIGLCADELYTLHSGSGKAGQGLTGWLTRGRELRQSFIGLTQRPVWISRFCFSEADCIIAMDLTIEADRNTFFEHTGQLEFMKRRLAHSWLCYDVAGDKLVPYGPVPA